MRGLFFAIGLLTAPLGAFAVTWDFDDGTTWGWTAQESGSYSTRGTSDATTVYSEVEDGVWRLAPVPGARRPTLQLRSPPIGEDSALFDSVTLRLRIIHHTPTEGRLLMQWFNSEYRRLISPSQDEALGQFLTGRLQLYPTQWEDITIDIRALEAAAEADPQVELTWQDTLFEFRLELDLNPAAQGPADHPAFVEVDWIQLTGVEELLLGELSPREIVVEAGLPGALFGEPAFFPLVEGITGKITRGIGGSAGTLGDVDGDGDVDLVAVWDRFDPATGRDYGWLIASNDGLGGFVPTQEEAASTNLNLQGSDFDGDGLLDLVFDRERIVELWHNRGEDGFEITLRLPGVEFVGLADGDGDGDVDLLVYELDDKSPHVVLWLNDGDAGFVRSDRFELDSEERLYPYPPSGQPPGEAVRLLWVQPCYEPQRPWQLTRPWAASEEPPLFFETGADFCTLHRLVDLDGDGAMELVGSLEERRFFVDYTYHGLAVWRLDASGGVSRHPLLGSQVHVSRGATASDFNGDGLLDLAVIDGNLATGPALVVLVGQRDGLPVVEGRYRLPGTGGQVLPGDVNGDGATDLVVLGRNMEGGPGGAFVFLNQNTPATAIAAETETTPSTFVLGANYPNPFNPATTIPFVVPAGVGDVDLTIYNVLGQPVRRVWAGSLVAGEHRLAWDGRDAAGQPVAAGVYWYRLQVDDQTSTRKMVKIE